MAVVGGRDLGGPGWRRNQVRGLRRYLRGRWTGHGGGLAGCGGQGDSRLRLPECWLPQINRWQGRSFPGRSQSLTVMKEMDVNVICKGSYSTHTLVAVEMELSKLGEDGGRGGKSVCSFASDCLHSGFS